MSRTTPSEELQLIESIVAAHPTGIGISGIEALLAQRHGEQPNRRKLQRRLQKLVFAKRLSVLGETSLRVYKITADMQVVPKVEGLSLFGDVHDSELYVSLSAEGSLVRDQIRMPLMHRSPVGYQREFLEVYQPGQTFYLSESLRRQLHEMGRMAGNEPPAATYARDLLSRLLVDLSWASSRLEGNTYSRLDTQNLIEFGQVANGKDAIETQMILNHKAAIEMLIEGGDEFGFDGFTFKNIHAVLSQDLMRDPQSSGRLRRRTVEISGTVYYPAAMPQVIEENFEHLMNKLRAIPDPFEQAFFLMVQLPYLQPFEDVNKRVSRIGANISLFKNRLCPLSFIDVPERAYVEGTLGVYELRKVDLLRDVFVWAYERSCQRYLAITQVMAKPDALKMKYREALIQAVQEVVIGKLKPEKELFEKVASKMVNGKDLEVFTHMLAQALSQLHEGNIARYRLRRKQYLAWALVVLPKAS